LTTILHINASGRQDGSVSRRLGSALVDRLLKAIPGSRIVRREAAADAQFLTQTWVEGTFADPDARSPEQEQALGFSAALVAELQAADQIVISTPIYNFSIPACLKAWIDQICRPGMTFRAEPDGFVGLVPGKKAYLVIASGGTEVQGPIDFATGYLVHILAFLGITDVTIIPAHHLLDQHDVAIRKARAQIEAITAAPRPEPGLPSAG